MVDLNNLEGELETWKDNPVMKKKIKNLIKTRDVAPAPKKEKAVVKKQEVTEEDLYKMTKSEQVEKLEKLGVDSKKIPKLEKGRVDLLKKLLK